MCSRGRGSARERPGWLLARNGRRPVPRYQRVGLKPCYLISPTRDFSVPPTPSPPTRQPWNDVLVKPKEHSGTTVTKQSMIHLRAPEAEAPGEQWELRTAKQEVPTRTPKPRRRASRDWTDAQGPSSQAPINPSARSTTPKFQRPGRDFCKESPEPDRPIHHAERIQGGRVGRVGTPTIPQAILRCA